MSDELKRCFELVKGMQNNGFSDEEIVAELVRGHNVTKDVAKAVLAVWYIKKAMFPDVK